jgi:hypothetical protein
MVVVSSFYRFKLVGPQRGWPLGKAVVKTLLGHVKMF